MGSLPALAGGRLCDPRPVAGVAETVATLLMPVAPGRWLWRVGTYTAWSIALVIPGGYVTIYLPSTANITGFVPVTEGYWNEP